MRVLFEYLGGGYPPERFLDGFENSPPREMVMAVLALAAREIERGSRAA
ncbi:MAG: hypothetical protein IT438_06400 [Phycisphaerales bacterium]|nr:hypothetical protein [Phycisphaerales bacterium]